MPPSNDNKRLKQLSHTLSWVLRHAAPKLGLDMSPDGYVAVDHLLQHSHPRLQGWTSDDIEDVVRASDKQRFRLKRIDHVLCIRANQGHSIHTVQAEQLLRKLQATELAALPVIVHGTTLKAWSLIPTKGLSRMTRQHVHFATGLPGASGVISGMRRSCAVYIYVNAKKCADDGLVFYESDNGVLLTAGMDGVLPMDYVSHVTLANGEILLDQRGVQKCDEEGTLPGC